MISILAAIGGAVSFGILCVGLQGMWMERRARKLGLTAPKYSRADMQLIESFCRELVAETIYRNDQRWLRRVLR